MLGSSLAVLPAAQKSAGNSANVASAPSDMNQLLSTARFLNQYLARLYLRSYVDSYVSCPPELGADPPVVIDSS